MLRPAAEGRDMASTGHAFCHCCAPRYVLRLAAHGMCSGVSQPPQYIEDVCGASDSAGSQLRSSSRTYRQTSEFDQETSSYTIPILPSECAAPWLSSPQGRQCCGAFQLFDGPYQPALLGDAGRSLASQPHLAYRRLLLVAQVSSGVSAHFGDRAAVPVGRESSILSSRDRWWEGWGGWEGYPPSPP